MAPPVKFSAEKSAKPPKAGKPRPSRGRSRNAAQAHAYLSGGGGGHKVSSAPVPW